MPSVLLVDTTEATIFMILHDSHLLKLQYASINNTNAERKRAAELHFENIDNQPNPLIARASLLMQGFVAPSS